MRRFLFTTLVLALFVVSAKAAEKPLKQLQQDFVDLRFGMFIHFNIPTFAPDDWPDPDLPASAFNPEKLNCYQWARAAKSAGMTYGCLTTKHHSGFCIWNTKTTDYNVMNSPLKRDVVKEFVDAFRNSGLKVMLYYSILDTHHRLRPHLVTRQKVDMIKAQLHELLTNYGPITALIIDGWDAPWSRIGYDDVPFPEIYNYIKSLQPECLVMDLNAAKYPREALFYTDIKSYEQGAGQKISTSENNLPALACLPLQQNWFWKQSFPTDKLKSPEWIVNENIIPYGKAHCNFILNVAPNRDGLMDDNALEALKEIGKRWKNNGQSIPLPDFEDPITEKNIAKNKPSESSWSWDMNIMDFANDDDFSTAWESNKYVPKPFWMVEIGKNEPVDMITITEPKGGVIQKYSLEYRSGNVWKTLFSGAATTQSRVKIHRFPTVMADAVRITIMKSNGSPAISEFGVYSSER
jgi:alpha-L-fucosidase